MNIRNYNILFHTHTISGIIISAALYVIFFAGSYSFFRDDIEAWERNEPAKESVFLETDINALVENLALDHDLKFRDITLSQHKISQRINVSLSAPKDTLDESRQRGAFFYMNLNDYSTSEYKSAYTLGEFLYRLHFFAQLNLYGRSGYLFAGIVSFFFLFALITGVWIHWDKIISNFYLFRPKAKLKNLWTDAHTALGIIGLPYQFIFALTGVFLIIGTTVLAPPVLSIIYKGDQESMYADMGFGVPEYKPSFQTLDNVPDLNFYVEEVQKSWGEFELRSISLFAYGDQNMRIIIEGVPLPASKFTGKGKAIFKAGDLTPEYEVDPYGPSSYLQGSNDVLRKLHFGDFGGLGLRIVYFILGLVSCVVILSGVLIWLVARDKKSTPDIKRKFNKWLVWIYMAICLGMYPVTAISFLAVKLSMSASELSPLEFIYHWYFYSWLIISIILVALRDNFKITKWSMLSGGILGLAIPISNGYQTGNWLWKTFNSDQIQIFTVDMLWLLTSILSLWVAFMMRKKDNSNDSIEHNDYQTSS
ncbi:PepSY-associated TM helix domain-containing protein [Belliella kenyensis]|uniref:PepSY-associated TM helix domain-containing protein n=1 Tax=Belliella kenyensis TaxID=1472724 RepID=A0ABV8EQA8_9BACT|nr:PepSY-associated TM helix domain-containing protein [Belliella kenyensis]MCH7400806.1 PepSY domain-containing protein [Belliella kenyensis]MDN3601906.1 PepSY-associated TM helix domain-containing protein [Belliella kenyensis]